MDRPTAVETVRAALAVVLKGDPGPIEEDENLVEIGLVDSLDSMRLLFEIEKRVGCKIIAANEVKLETFHYGRLINLVTHAH
jgi:acyl carrier protein